MIHIYRPQRSWGKVMFLQASVILLTGGGRVPGQVLPMDQVHTPGTRYPPGPGTPPQDQVPPWARYPQTRYTPPGTRYTPLPRPGAPHDQVHPP